MGAYGICDRRLHGRPGVLSFREQPKHSLLGPTRKSSRLRASLRRVSCLRLHTTLHTTHHELRCGRAWACATHKLKPHMRMHTKEHATHIRHCCARSPWQLEHIHTLASHARPHAPSQPCTLCPFGPPRHCPLLLRVSQQLRPVPTHLIPTPEPHSVAGPHLLPPPRGPCRQRLAPARPRAGAWQCHIRLNTRQRPSNHLPRARPSVFSPPMGGPPLRCAPRRPSPSPQTGRPRTICEPASAVPARAAFDNPTFGIVADWIHHLRQPVKVKG